MSRFGGIFSVQKKKRKLSYITTPDTAGEIIGILSFYSSASISYFALRRLGRFTRIVYLARNVPVRNIDARTYGVYGPIWVRVEVYNTIKSKNSIVSFPETIARTFPTARGYYYF